MSFAIYNGNQYAYPTPDEAHHARNGGITKREYLAAMAMAGITGNATCTGEIGAVVRDAIRYADALLEALEKSQ
jgi:hypothetical protein